VDIRHLRLRSFTAGVERVSNTFTFAAQLTVVKALKASIDSRCLLLPMYEWDDKTPEIIPPPWWTTSKMIPHRWTLTLVPTLGITVLYPVTDDLLSEYSENRGFKV
jgi:hypothetical protein